MNIVIKIVHYLYIYAIAIAAKNGIKFNEAVNNIGELIRSQEINQFEDRNFNGNISFDTYLSHAEVSLFYVQLAS